MRAPPDATARPAVPVDLFKRGMRRLAAAVTLVTTRHHHRRLGLTATAVCPVTTRPPTLLACVNTESPACAAIQASGAFCVNVLAAEDVELARRFAAEPGGETRFAAGRWTSRATGAPILETALASFDCEVSGSLPVGTHTVFLGRVVGVSIHPGRPGLLYADGRYLQEPSTPI